MSTVLGCEQPRLFTLPLRELTPETSLGFEATEWIEKHLFPLLPWQRWWLVHALELRPDGTLRFRTLITLIARQNGKSRLMQALTLWMIFTGRAKLALGAAQSLDVAREAWTGAVDLAQDDDDLRMDIARVRMANGEQELRLASGARYKITAATRSAGRGLSVDLLNLDELREHRDWLAWGALSKTTTARPQAITAAFSNAGDDDSVVLNSLRDGALAAIEDPETRVFLAEWSAPDGCELDDVEAIRQANPGLGHIIDIDSIHAARLVDPPAVYRTETLCQRVAAMDGAIDLAAWTDSGDIGTLDGVRDRVCLGLDVSPDLQHVTLVAAALLDDGRVRAEVVAAWSSTEDARYELDELLDRIKPRAVGWLPGGPAAALAADLRGRRGLTEIKSADVGAICQGLAEFVSARRVLHSNDPLLTAQVQGASKLYSGDGWRFTRKGVGHVDGVYALSAAVHLARTLPAPRERPRLILPRAS
ncbi:terminase [Jiangella asiatica]|uniref:terminase n=1 Tax=Jiangella asiatica TaxID=2530372 RepID=UPI0013A5CBD0|nr:terminase [Jiangella asiatica]